MPSKHKLIQNFYKSNEWKLVRAIKIACAGGICEGCGMVADEVHHKIHLTPENVVDPNISINQDNLLLLCKECHNKAHERFRKSQIFDKDGNFIDYII